MRKEGINKKSRGQKVGIGYLLILKDIDREEYIETCFRTSSAAIVMQTGEFYQRVKVSKGLMNHFDFPLDDESRGSAVIWIAEDITGIPIIIGVLAYGDEVSGMQENELLFAKEYEGNSISINGNAKEGIININTNAGEKGILSLNSDNILKLFGKNINSEGEIFAVKAEDTISFTIKKVGDDPTTTIIYKLGTGFNYKDEFDNELEINKNHIKFKGKKFILESDQSSLKQLTIDIVTAMSKIQIATSLGNQSPLNMVEIQEILNKKIGEVFE